MDDLGGFPPIFGSTPIFSIHLPPQTWWIFPEDPKLQYDLSIQAPQGQRGDQKTTVATGRLSEVMGLP